MRRLVSDSRRNSSFLPILPNRTRRSLTQPPFDPRTETGYTGYINSERNIGVPVKGHSAFAGRRVDDATTRANAANVTFDAVPRTLYEVQHPAHTPEAYRVPDGTGGGYWIGDARKAAGTESVAPARAKFLAKSSYQHDISAPREAAGVVRPRSPIRPAGRAPAGSAGDPPARLDDTSRYDRDYGKAGSDPRARAPPANGRGLGAGISQRSTTADLASGLVRSTKHLPGYSGFIAGSAYNPTALDHSDGVLTKGSLKDQALLRALDQFHRDRVPGETLWRPQHPRNVRMDPPTPTRATSAGASAHETWRRGQPERVRSLGGEQGPGVMSFFSPGVETVSEAGVADAQRFYAVARPLEGVSCPAAYPSRTTARGARFTR